ncbi:hypothetical protein BCV70DRAFT_49999 [Testicularia cyperi]|uniref:Uncharacterized protein n=1 Tax=Testicularia cyperi TaxID=1882483 RepID=A0A317XJX2_9BASI|nr:hypothetical protein BCV70DRAFT_49999 [Testicularia cyperi]
MVAQFRSTCFSALLEIVWKRDRRAKCSACSADLHQPPTGQTPEPTPRARSASPASTKGRATTSAASYISNRPEIDRSGKVGARQGIWTNTKDVDNVHTHRPVITGHTGPQHLFCRWLRVCSPCGEVRRLLMLVMLVICDL